MPVEVVYGILIPFLGTTLGAACVFLLKHGLHPLVQRGLTGFAAGVMTAASVWSLLIPAMEYAESMGRLSFVPAVVGFWLGVLFLLALDHCIPHLHQGSDEPEGPKSSLRRSTMLMLAVTLHNIPEGMAVGVVFAGWMSGQGGLSLAAALALALGIAIQNFPEGAILSMPLSANGMKKSRAFMQGMISGVAELLAALVTLWASKLVVPVLPYLLSFAAGAMIYVVVEELIPESSQGSHSNLGTIFFSLGFTLMLVLDVALGA
ncbi:MAG: ZIP family metal transporter [Clostridiales bacterium]|nr:ZIP family metal transporter [Clostridiales bacterium]